MGLRRRIDATPARRHVEALIGAGFTVRGIAEAAGASPSTIGRLRHPGKSPSTGTSRPGPGRDPRGRPPPRRAAAFACGSVPAAGSRPCSSSATATPT
ncbi:MAG: hypothetical protein U0Q19_10135 [Kineosporiaceae bacterium]